MNTQVFQHSSGKIAFVRQTDTQKCQAVMDIKTMLKLQRKKVHYNNYINISAPCILFSKNSMWNDFVLMVQHCGDNQYNFQEHVLKISD
jgi:hypothetical protein